MSGLSRRELFLAAAGCWIAAADDTNSAGSPATLADALAALVPDARAAARLGWRFLYAESWRPRNRAGLGRAIVPAVDDERAFMDASVHDRKRLLRNRITADFAAGRTVVVDGWVLAETEALLAALVALG